MPAVQFAPRAKWRARAHPAIRKAARLTVPAKRSAAHSAQQRSLPGGLRRKAEKSGAAYL